MFTLYSPRTTLSSTAFPLLSERVKLVMMVSFAGFRYTEAKGTGSPERESATSSDTKKGLSPPWPGRMRIPDGWLHKGRAHSNSSMGNMRFIATEPDKVWLLP